eukprot:scaffold104901_cov33-Phaeocystis_antarctica.AAC.1
MGSPPRSSSVAASSANLRRARAKWSSSSSASSAASAASAASASAASSSVCSAAAQVLRAGSGFIAQFHTSASPGG